MIFFFLIGFLFVRNLCIFSIELYIFWYTNGVFCANVNLVFVSV